MIYDSVQSETISPKCLEKLFGQVDANNLYTDHVQRYAGVTMPSSNDVRVM